MNKLEFNLHDMRKFSKLTPNVERIYEEEAVQKNSISMKFVALVILIVEIFNICRVLLFTNAKLSTVNNQIYFTMYVIMLLSAVLFPIIEQRLKGNRPALTRLYVWVAYFWMTWHAVLNCYDLSRNADGDITIFLSALLILAIFAQIRPRHTLRIAILSYLIVMCFSGGALDAGDYINATIYLAMACIVAWRVYLFSIVHIQQRFEITEKNELLEKERAELKNTLDKYEILLSNTNDHIFELDFFADTLTFVRNSNIDPRVGRVIYNVSQWLHTQKIINPDDTVHLIEGMKELVMRKDVGDYTFRIVYEDGTETWYRLRVYVNHSADGVAMNGIGIVANVDAQQKRMEMLDSQTKTDPMTGLLNAVAFQNNCNIALKNLGENEYLMMFMVDLDDFKMINDTYGHFAGDCVLKEVARVMHIMFREYDFAARLGGDEFAIIMRNVKNIEIANKKAEQLIHEVSMIAVTEHNIKVTCSVGIAVTNDKHTDYDEIYRCADKALYKAKDQGKGCYIISD